MAKPKPSDQNREEREQLAVEWKKFRKIYLLTQKRLGDVIGISRRTIQQIEAARILPHFETVRKFMVYRDKTEANASPGFKKRAMANFISGADHTARTPAKRKAKRMPKARKPRRK